MTTQRIQLQQPMPYFAELPYYLWGPVNYDSEGDCTKPTDRQWTDLYLQNRGTGEIVELSQENGECVIKGDEQTIARLAMFLVERCDATGHTSISEAAAGQWDHTVALARALPVAMEFDQTVLEPFDNHLFWGSWKWTGLDTSDLTGGGRWIMHSVVRKDPRAIALCIDWIKTTRFPGQAKALAYAVQLLSGESARSPRDWVRWYKGGWFSKGAKLRYPAPDMEAWLAEWKHAQSKES